MNMNERTALAEASDLASGNQNHIDLTCPMCNQPRMHHILELNALCRQDNETYICSSCGTKQALQAWTRAHNAEARRESKTRRNSH